VFLGYPLHPPKQPDKQRAEHLPRIGVPLLFVQGERDPFGTPAELAPIVQHIPRARVYVVPSGDHSLSVPKRLRAQGLVDADVDDVIARFVVELAPGPFKTKP
jgi:predicted alpha/beta-hydrolase family hydrolase